MPSGSDSLRAVLLSSRCAPRSHQCKSVAMSGDPLDPPGHYFPAKLAMSAGLIKLFFGIVMFALGGVAIMIKIPLALLGAGLWVGVVVIVSGFLGICAARRPYAQIYVISFMSVSILSMAASGLLIVLSATGWARETQKPEIMIYDTETDSELDLFGTILLSRPSVFVSGALVTLGVLDVLLSLACVAMSAKESCGTHGSVHPFGVPEGTDRKERLYRWLGQQKHFLHTVPKPKGGAGSHFGHLSSNSTVSTGHTAKRSYSTRSNSRELENSSTPSTVVVYPSIAEERLAAYSDLVPYSFPIHSKYHNDMFPAEREQQHVQDKNRMVRRSKTDRRKSKRRKKRLSSKPKKLTDKQIEKTYTGLDREIAEKFISFAMDPSAKKALNDETMSI